MTQLLWTNQFRDRLFEIETSNLALAHRIGASITYLNDFGRSAVAPDVKWNLSTSDFATNSGEIRWPTPEDQERYPNDAWRGLFIAATDTSWILFTLLGNKAGQRKWYDKAVPLSDSRAREYRIAREAANDPIKNFPQDV